MLTPNRFGNLQIQLYQGVLQVNMRLSKAPQCELGLHNFFHVPYSSLCKKNVFYFRVSKSTFNDHAEQRLSIS
ncbi:hypothetical protein PGT21_015545 [Puccinia graminis f. sp. tritici]|uniref:Uncharacterized protein n=1 Tax=Puccinia graminis f. sp. tritici TaxID=56615 RepID=A0A5B0QAX8_PUCGR|nr:hypothetical protein PGT21_015545 [Puccinia graminis f. sp. tritici]